MCDKISCRRGIIKDQKLSLIPLRQIEMFVPREIFEPKFYNPEIFSSLDRVILTN